MDITRTAKAAVYEAPNTPFVIKEYPLRPNPCAGILGHEIIGVIEEIGEGVGRDMRGDRLRVGGRVTWTEYFYEGECYYRDILDMPQKCHGAREYGHDLTDEGPHFANLLVKKWITLRGIHNYHARHLIQALDFVLTHRKRFPFNEIVDSKLALHELDEAFRKAADRSVLRAAIVL